MFVSDFFSPNYKAIFFLKKYLFLHLEIVCYSIVTTLELMN